MLDAALSGLAYAALGLLLQVCWRGLRRFRRSPWQLGVCVGVTLAVALAGLSVPMAVLLIAPVSIAFAFWWPA